MTDPSMSQQLLRHLDDWLNESLGRVESSQTVGGVLAELAALNMRLPGTGDISNDAVKKLQEWIDKALDKLRKLLAPFEGATITVAAGFPHVSIAVAFPPLGSGDS